MRVGPTNPAFRFYGAEPKALEAGPYFLSWSCMMVVGEQQVGEKSSQVAGYGRGCGWWEKPSPVLSILTACSPLLLSRVARFGGQDGPSW